MRPLGLTGRAIVPAGARAVGTFDDAELNQ